MDQAFGADLHGLRVVSLANGVAGVLNAAVLSVHAIGRAYAELSHTSPKNGVKQVDRMLSNDGLDLERILRAWARFVIGTHPSVVIAMDWTDFEAGRPHDSLRLPGDDARPSHARGLKTVKKSKLAGRQARLELEMVERLGSWLPEVGSDHAAR